MSAALAALATSAPCIGAGVATWSMSGEAVARTTQRDETPPTTTTSPANATPTGTAPAAPTAPTATRDKSDKSVRITPSKQPRVEPPPEPPAKPEGRLAAPEIDLGFFATDGSRLPRVEPPNALVQGREERGLSPLVGRSGELARPPLVDRSRRLQASPRPPSFGFTLLPGERFKYDIIFGGNPTGIAEAGVVAREPGPNGSPDRIRLEGSARTSGVVALLTTLVYDMAAYVDATTGAPIETGSITRREGLPGAYKRRETTTTYFGRGFVEIADKRDERSSTLRKRLPVETFDPLSIMAWVRSLDLKPGEKVKAYGLDGTVLLRVDITGKGPVRFEGMPPIGTSLGIAPDQVQQFEGVITRVDRYGAAIPGKKAYKMRVWVSTDGRRIPLAVESDIWFGVVRLVLTQYDPPRPQASSGAPAGPPARPPAAVPAAGPVPG
ncbi:DUF3108 domain-containing protein [Nannocystis pusilla]|uniref:DUF3108 domain-containing protein n=1 Tax=Nannocystis pusilla TaxID=889268 RepID=A0ABS7THQ7_9BACT|nr:DUF3108 domain-containing protein [Nannocystis pusilla]MBZ5707745.1 DUF3108 domain-containing protein [Nannocystis pusilla]